MARGPFVTLEGEVKRIGDKSLWFRETNAAHDICIPLSQIEEPNNVETGDAAINVTRWILQRLDDEGKR